MRRAGRTGSESTSATRTRHSLIQPQYVDRPIFVQEPQKTILRPALAVDRRQDHRRELGMRIIDERVGRKVEIATSAEGIAEHLRS